MLTFILASLFLAAPKNPALLSEWLVPQAEAASADYSTTTLQAFASSTATRNGLDPILFSRVIECESQWSADAIGDNGTSIGLVQLHYPSRDWHISTSSAKDPFLSIQIMADAWTKGEQWRWSCWQLLHAKKLDQSLFES